MKVAHRRITITVDVEHNVMVRHLVQLIMCYLLNSYKIYEKIKYIRNVIF